MAQFLQLAYGDIFADAYRIVQPLSQGGMGAVYLVEQLATSKRRALKLMHPDLVVDQKLLKRFEQEARVGALIESDHVVEVIDAGVEPQSGIPWLAMELLIGEDLAAYLRRKGALNISEVRSIFAQLCHALGAAHALGIVHRDLKPENIFLATPRREGISYTLKVLDFGVAKVVAEASATATAAIGTPLWMAPEQMSSDGTIEPSTDVWALGLLAYRLLTGCYYWRSAEAPGGSLMSIMREVGFDPLPRATDRARESRVDELLPEGFDTWFSRCVTRNQPSRFRNANEVKTQFDQLIGAILSVPSGPIPLFLGERQQAGSITLVGQTGPVVEARTAHDLNSTADVVTEDLVDLSHDLRALGIARHRDNYNETAIGLSAESAMPPRRASFRMPRASTGIGTLVAAVALISGVLWYRSSRGAGVANDGDDEDGPPTVEVPSPRGSAPSAASTSRASPSAAAGDPGMASLAGGHFIMSDFAQRDGKRVESKSDIVLRPYAIDRHEVTTEQFHACVDAGKCSAEGLKLKLDCTFGKKSADTVMNCVNFEQASDFCTFRGKRLPTEEEWEFAARGQSVLRFTDGTHNGWEWTSTELCPVTGGATSCTRPVRVARGGAPLRLKLEPTHRDTDLGFRCVRDP